MSKEKVEALLTITIYLAVVVVVYFLILKPIYDFIVVNYILVIVTIVIVIILWLYHISRPETIEKDRLNDIIKIKENEKNNRIYNLPENIEKRKIKEINEEENRRIERQQRHEQDVARILSNGGGKRDGNISNEITYVDRGEYRHPRDFEENISRPESTKPQTSSFVKDVIGNNFPKMNNNVNPRSPNMKLRKVKKDALRLDKYF